MTGTMTSAGLDVHARSTHAAAIDAMTGELVRARFGPGVDEPVCWLAGLRGPVKAWYEAGPTGFGLYRAVAAAGVDMRVIAPGKTRGPSDGVKTDRRDAELLARLLLAGSLAAVVVPPARVEAAREMTRAHDARRVELMDARHRVSKMLLRHGIVYPMPSTWTMKHRRWLSRQQFDEAVSGEVFADLLAGVDAAAERKAQNARRISELATDQQWWPTIARLRCFRGIDALTALSLHLELGADWARFEKPSSLASWLGLTPTLSQSGETSRQGSITKTGSVLARRLLVEAAWHHTRPPAVGAPLQRRQAGQAPEVIAISRRAQQRLHHVHTRMRARGKPGNVTVVAVARELVCFLLGRRDPRLTSTQPHPSPRAGAPGHQAAGRAIAL